MALIEGFRVQNYRSLRDVTLGSFGDRSVALTPLTAVIGSNGSGKSTLFDTFGFLADCLAVGVEAACDKEQRGGVARMRSQIDADETGRPFVPFEGLVLHEPPSSHRSPTEMMTIHQGKGVYHRGDFRSGQSEALPVILTDFRQLGIASLGSLGENLQIARFRDFLKGWYLSYFTPEAARILPAAGPQRHLNKSGDNIGNFVQFMERDNPLRLQSVLCRIAERIPGIEKIETVITEDKRVLLRFNDRGFVDPFFAPQMSDGTLKLFAYMLLLEDPEPPPLICIEEPENGLYPKLLETLAREFRAHATGLDNAPQIIITTHQPYFVDALSPEEVWILEKGADGFSTIRRASDIELVRNMVAEGLPLGGLWFSDYLDPR